MPEVVTDANGDPTFVLKVPEGAPQSMDIFQATAALKKAREAAYASPEEPLTPKAEEPVTGGSAPEPAPTDSPPPAADAAPPEEAPSETTPEAEPELPAIDPPRSWAREEKERFRTLPRETQEYIAERESQREREFTKTQQETAEERRKYEAQIQAAERARAEYEARLPAMANTLRAQLASEFPDVRSQQDLERLATENPARFNLWQLSNQKLAQAQRAQDEAQQRLDSEIFQKWNEFKSKEDKATADAIPDLSDPVKGQKLRDGARRLLTDIGFDKDELDDSWGEGHLPGAKTGKGAFSLRDHRIQLLIHDAVMWRQAQAARKTMETKKAKVPPVQKPGVVRSTAPDHQADIAALNKALETATGQKALMLSKQLTQARRAAGLL